MRFRFNQMTTNDIGRIVGDLCLLLQSLGQPNDRHDPKQKHGWPIRIGDTQEKEGVYTATVELGSATRSQSWQNNQHCAQFDITLRRDPKHKSRALIEVSDHGDGFLELDNSVTSPHNFRGYMKAVYTTHGDTLPGGFKHDLHDFLKHLEKTGKLLSDQKLGRLGSYDEVEAICEDRHPVAGAYVKPPSR
jgi:hypothetical protein